MNAIQMLKDDHRKVEELFREYEAASDSENVSRKKEIADKACMELEVHSKLEEEIFYPAFRAKADEEGKELVAESIEEHQTVKNLIQELRNLNPEDDEFDDTFDELMDDVKHHVEEEESQMLPEAEGLLSDEMDRLTSRMEERKEQLMTSPRVTTS